MNTVICFNDNFNDDDSDSIPISVIEGKGTEEQIKTKIMEHILTCFEWEISNQNNINVSFYEKEHTKVLLVECEEEESNLFETYSVYFID